MLQVILDKMAASKIEVDLKKPAKNKKNEKKKKKPAA